MQAIPRQSSSTSLTSFSTTSTPSHSPVNNFLEDRLNALLANFENGTHAFCRDRTAQDGLAMATKLSQATAAAAAAQKAAQSQPMQARRPSLISMLSLSRPNNGQNHFDPSREPKLHGLP